MYFGVVPANTTGIVAHGQISNNRSDGRVTVYYMWLRKTKGMSQSAAYARLKHNMSAVCAEYRQKGPRKKPNRLVPAHALGGIQGSGWPPEDEGQSMSTQASMPPGQSLISEGQSSINEGGA